MGYVKDWGQCCIFYICVDDYLCLVGFKQQTVKNHERQIYPKQAKHRNTVEDNFR